MRDGRPPVNAPDLQLGDQIAKLAFGEVRVPREHHQLVERRQLRWPDSGRADEHRRADGAAPARQFACIRLVADVPVEWAMSVASGTGGRNGRAGAVAGRAIASDVAVHALSAVTAIRIEGTAHPLDAAARTRDRGHVNRAAELGMAGLSRLNL